MTEGFDMFYPIEYNKNWLINHLDTQKLHVFQ